MRFTGTVHKFGASVDTDQIIPARYLNNQDPQHLAAHCLEDADPTFAKRVKPGDVVVADENFGSGSSREHAVVAIKAAGVSCVVAKSFARIFYRNCLNQGLPVVVCPAAADAAREGSTIAVDLVAGTVELDGRQYQAEPMPPFMQHLLQSGGLVEYARRRLEAASAAQG